MSISRVFVRDFTFNFFKIFASVTVSGKPPLFVIITAHPLADASKLVLPKGSSHREQATAIFVFLKMLSTSLCFLKPRISARLCLQIIFSLFSSPIIFAVQSGYLFNIRFIEEENIS